ncbi:uncharacterized protein [Panulirus ornatus]|uniref:uncharacterized protein n=1 Tax=Panulirus ornatus TaxID=150431 RepID=UPI003A86FC97
MDISAGKSRHEAMVNKEDETHPGCQQTIRSKAAEDTGEASTSKHDAKSKKSKKRNKRKTVKPNSPDVEEALLICEEIQQMDPPAEQSLSEDVEYDYHLEHYYSRGTKTRASRNAIQEGGEVLGGEGHMEPLLGAREEYAAREQREQLDMEDGDVLSEERDVRASDTGTGDEDVTSGDMGTEDELTREDVAEGVHVEDSAAEDIYSVHDEEDDYVLFYMKDVTSGDPDAGVGQDNAKGEFSHAENMREEAAGDCRVTSSDAHIDKERLSHKEAHERKKHDRDETRGPSSRQRSRSQDAVGKEASSEWVDERQRIDGRSGIPVEEVSQDDEPPSVAKDVSEDCRQGLVDRQESGSSQQVDYKESTQLEVEVRRRGTSAERRDKKHEKKSRHEEALEDNDGKKSRHEEALEDNDGKKKSRHEEALEDNDGKKSRHEEALEDNDGKKSKKKNKNRTRTDDNTCRTSEKTSREDREEDVNRKNIRPESHGEEGKRIEGSVEEELLIDDKRERRREGGKDQSKKSKKKHGKVDKHVGARDPTDLEDDHEDSANKDCKVEESRDETQPQLPTPQKPPEDEGVTTSEALTSGQDPQAPNKEEIAALMTLISQKKDKIRSLQLALNRPEPTEPQTHTTSIDQTADQEGVTESDEDDDDSQGTKRLSPIGAEADLGTLWVFEPPPVTNMSSRLNQRAPVVDQEGRDAPTTQEERTVDLGLPEQGQGPQPAECVVDVREDREAREERKKERKKRKEAEKRKHRKKDRETDEDQNIDKACGVALREGGRAVERGGVRQKMRPKNVKRQTNA